MRYTAEEWDKIISAQILIESKLKKMPVKKHEELPKYIVPVYEINQEGLNEIDNITIDIVKGEKGNTVQVGVIIEDLLKMIIHHLTTVNVGELANRDTSVAITNLETALLWLQKRTQDRKERGVLNTYEK